MGKMKESPRYRVVSVRVSDEEMLFLKHICEEENTTCSQFIRAMLARAGYASGMLAEDGRMAPPCSG